MSGAACVADAEYTDTRPIHSGSSEYPAGLRDLADAPPCIWVRGPGLERLSRCVAIVGSRAASTYGASFTRRLARDLAGAGYVVVSGLARGIDAAAHAGALEAGGRTIGVVPSGLDCITPPDHAGLAADITMRGALLSERPSGPPFGRGAFVKRNRLIAALSAVTVVVEAAERSGALSTAAFARALGRPVLAVPGDVDRPTALGPLQLLRAGATVCGGAADVLAAMPAPATGETTAALPVRSRLAGALADEGRTLEQLAALAGVSEVEALGELLALEWAGIARAVPGQRWRRGGTTRA